MRAIALVFLLACGGAVFTPEPPKAFDPAGVKLVVGVERPKTFVVARDGEITSTEIGQSSMRFVGTELRTLDGTKAILSVSGDELRAGDKHIGSYEGDALVIHDVRLTISDDGVVWFEHHSQTKKLRLHFEGPIVGHRRPALLLVAFVFAVYAAAHPTASIDRFVSD